MTDATEKVLLVDDERSVLLACQRHLYGHCNFCTAENGEQALAAITREGPFAVIVSDYRMPRMDGLTLLAEAARNAPDTVRILLTGYADVEVALEAINRGKIFRLLTKPTSSDVLLHAIQDGVKQYRLIKGERELLKNTVSGSVKVLTEIFSMTNPVAFGQAVRISRLAKALARRFGLANAWEIELAAILSQIGSAAVPTHILEKRHKGEDLSEEEMSIFQAHPAIGQKLLSNIPRLEKITEGVKCQLKYFDGTGFPPGKIKGTALPFLARLLRVALDYDCHCGAGKSNQEALQLLHGMAGKYDPTILAALEAEVLSVETGHIVKNISIVNLEPGMLLADDMRDINGAILAPRGCTITELLRTRMHNFSRFGVIEEPVKVLVKIKVPGIPGRTSDWSEQV